MIEIAQTYIGNIKQDADLAELITKENCLEVSLQESDRQKGRIHAYTASGTAVGIIKSRDLSLLAGDLFRTDSGKLILIQLQEQELLVLDLFSLNSGIDAVKLITLGHALGNHHYPITIHNHKIYIQLTTDKLILEKIINELNIPELKINYEIQSCNQNLTLNPHHHH